MIEMESQEADEKVRRAYEPLKDGDGLVQVFIVLHVMWSEWWS